jgi:hypothetical protein
MKKVIFIVFSAAALFACREKKQIDVKNPVIESVLVNGTVTSSIVAHAGDVINIEAQFTDNMGLSQVMMDLHAADDGHVHNGEGDQGGQERLNVGRWLKNDLVNVSGTSASHSWQLVVPDSIAGNWHIQISALDEVGLVASGYVVLLNIQNENLPVITGTTTPAVDNTGTVYMSAGSNLGFSGLASDPDGLKRFFAYLRNNQGYAGDTLEIPIVGEGYTMEFGPASFDNTPAGTYYVVIEAIDSLGYKGKWDAKVIAQ